MRRHGFNPKASLLWVGGVQSGTGHYVLQFCCIYTIPPMRRIYFFVYDAV